jgi:tripartite-type tricarboxylate transporter receptor subunit TctC
MNRHACAFASVAVVVVCAAAPCTHAQTYPQRPIRVIVPFVPGGGTDIMARAFGQKFTEARGQSVVIDNRGGGGGRIGVETAVRSIPDGYTLCMVSPSYATNAAMFKLPFDPVNDITPIALVANSGSLMSVHPGVPAKTAKELIAYAKAKPGAINFASSGTGGATHLTTELFSMMAGIKMTHVPYKGTGAAVVDVISGQVQLTVSPIPVLRPHVLAGRLRGLGVTSPKRSPALPDIPAIAETVPGFETGVWYGLWGPKGLAKEVVNIWNAEVRKAAQHADMKERFAAEGLEGVDAPPEHFREVVARDIAKWNKVVAVANIPRVQ